MTTHTSHQNGCLMCAVRALTEGAPAATWSPTETGQTVSGVVLKMGELDGQYGPVPFVDLWTGGTGRLRIKAFPAGLQHALAKAEAQVGDTLSVWFDGTRTVESGKYAGRQVKTYSANVQRGH